MSEVSGESVTSASPIGAESGERASGRDAAVDAEILAGDKRLASLANHRTAAATSSAVMGRQ